MYFIFYLSLTLSFIININNYSLENHGVNDPLDPVSISINFNGTIKILFIQMFLREFLHDFNNDISNNGLFFISYRLISTIVYN